jgi:DNA mismatch repair protein MutL
MTGGKESTLESVRTQPARIHILPDHVANQIAAGEVVERPASVVKELVENSLDAGARRVEIAIRNGGKTEIRVSDDGCGMGRADALLALDRHATSKIREADDLSRIRSFGFRGEALPAIAAVSRFELLTAGPEGAGTRVRATAGSIKSAEDAARQPGTTVTVRSLFQMVPARAKFLRTAAVETRAVSQAVLLLALANLQVHFRLESNGRELLDLPRAANLADRVEAIWGDDEVKALIDLDHAAGQLRVWGLIERPDAARHGGWRRYMFVNGRPFRDSRLLGAVDEGYRTAVAPGVRASAYLFLELPAGTVDVNVHPAKTEVRFHDRSAVEAAITAGISARLGRISSAAPLDRDAVRRGAVPGPAGPVAEFPDAERAGGPVAGGGSPPMPEADEAGEGQLALFVAGGAARDEDSDAGALPEVERPDLWQLHATYILASTRRGLLIIDQHSAHERVLYEDIMRGFSSGEAPSQRLLFPITVRLSPDEYTAVDELMGLFRRIGFELEPFGDRTLIVRSSPSLHAKFDPDRCFRDMVHELAHGSPLVDAARNQHERIAKSLACKGAIKAGTPLSQEEMTELFDRLFATELPGHDVHGRPTVVSLTLSELHRRFNRG